jgi:hypothetical protein
LSWAAIDGFRQWTVKRKRLLQGLLGLAVEGVAECVPGGGLAVWTTRIIGEFAKHGVERLADTSSDVPDVKAGGQSFSAEQLDQLNGWLAALASSYAGLLDRLDALVTLPAEESEEQLPSLIRQVLAQHADLSREFDARAEETRRQTLSLARIEERLDDIFHDQKRIGLSLEEIKALLLQCVPPQGEWEHLRQMSKRPASIRAFRDQLRGSLSAKPPVDLSVTAVQPATAAKLAVEVQGRSDGDLPELIARVTQWWLKRLGRNPPNGRGAGGIAAAAWVIAQLCSTPRSESELITAAQTHAMAAVGDTRYSRNPKCGCPLLKDLVRSGEVKVPQEGGEKKYYI